MRKIVFIIERRATQELIKKFGIDFLLRKKIPVKILNIAPYKNWLSYKKFIPSDSVKFPNEQILKNKTQIYAALKKLSTSDIVILNSEIQLETKFIVQELIKNKIDYGYRTNFDPIPQKKLYETIPLFFLYPIATIKKIIRRIFPKVHRQQQSKRQCSRGNRPVRGYAK